MIVGPGGRFLNLGPCDQFVILDPGGRFLNLGPCVRFVILDPSDRFVVMELLADL